MRVQMLQSIAQLNPKYMFCCSNVKDDLRGVKSAPWHVLSTRTLWRSNLQIFEQRRLHPHRSSKQNLQFTAIFI